MCEHSNGWRPEDGVPDLAMMSDITDQGININLRTRYRRDQIYTFSGSILIAVNPYRQLDIYSQAWVARYRKQRLNQTDPHVFALAEAMYMNLVMQDFAQHQQQASEKQTAGPATKNQACVISGESGAGKTETTKFILSYLCSVTPNKSTWMEHQILEANTILEAFGNAKTVRNDNSSRFGKFIQICFDAHYQINGCIIQDYLLEQSRITYQSIEERNYHVFYQLLAAGQTNPELRKKFHLMPPNFYDYLNKTHCYTVDGINDCAMFDQLRMAMSVLNMEQEMCDGLFSILSAILWLGNLQFQCDELSQNERCTLTSNDREIIRIISQLLGIDADELVQVMLYRQINVRGSVTEIPFKIYEARDNRNAMSKALYSKLFSWVVNFINASTNPGLDSTCFLGVLDIFGFENFDTNSFEQLCINYANEKLHKFFNHHMFAMEQELYQREGIEFCDINYTDNTPCLELLERPPNCILRLLSEECRMPKGNDVTFVEKLHTEFSLVNPNAFYIKGSDRRNWSSEFSIKHFAGVVTYNVNGFLKKNRDAQQSQLSNIIETSKNSLLRELMDDLHPKSRARSLSTATSSIDSEFEHSNSNNTRSKLKTQQSFSFGSSNSYNENLKVRRESSFTMDSPYTPKFTNPSHSSSFHKSKPSVADTFRQQLSSLVDLLNSVDPWYVRCIKPNLEKSAVDYDDEQALQQLKYLGMSDLIKIRREGYPIHLTKHQFVCRYRCLMLKHLRSDPHSSPIRLNEDSLHGYCVRMILHFKLDPKEWKIGKTMVLLRSSAYQPLEERRNELFIAMATLVQSHWRCYVMKRKYLATRKAACKIQHVFRAYRGRLLYLRKKRAVITIQAYVRGMFAREIANALRAIKRSEIEKARQAALERFEKQQLEERQRLQLESKQQTTIIINDAEGHVKQVEESTHSRDRQLLDCNTGTSSPLSQSNNSPAISSSASWVGSEPQMVCDEAKSRSLNRKDKREMEELVKVLERHGISLSAMDQSNEVVYADFEKLYDVLGNQLNTNGDNQSISPSVHDDDRLSFATTGTTCDGDSVSCSGQSQVSSTVNDDHACREDQTSERSSEAAQSMTSVQDDTINPDREAMSNEIEDNKCHSNSIDSIASIVSSSSIQSAPQQNTVSESSSHTEDSQIASSQTEHIVRQMFDGQLRTSTFTGAAMSVSGSKLVSNGRPLTRIEEEPNSAVTSPSKTPNKRATDATSMHSLFPPEVNTQPNLAVNETQAENKKRRLERKILQVQQEQNSTINPTTAGLPPCQVQTSIVSDPSAKEDVKDSDTSSEIYSVQKCDLIEYAESVFNNHQRDFSSSTGVIKTLTRRRKSIDSLQGECLSKNEMLSYNSSFVIPASHIKMHDPHNSQLACSMFKNLCKYMTGESAKSDNEIRIIQSIIRHGIEKLELRDEIYIQLVRQLTNNPHSDYSLRLWILLGLVSAAFPPSKTLAKHLIAYLRSKPKKDPSVTCQAQFCLDNLQAPRIYSRKYPPSPLEIQACKNLTNLKCKVYLLNGRTETLSIHPCDTAVDALTKLAQTINLQSIEGWALYETYTTGASKYPHPEFEQKGDSERSVRSHYFIADLIASWQEGCDRKQSTSNSLKLSQKRIDAGNFKLTLKKRIFRGPKIRNDPIEISLLYSQAVHNVVKKDNFLVDENLGLSLAGLQAQVMFGNAIDMANSTSGVKKKSLKSRPASKNPSQVYEVDSFICQRLRVQHVRSNKEWTNLIAQSHKQFHGVNEVFCKMRYLSMVIYHCPLYGTATFSVSYKGYQKLDQNLMLGVNAEGLVLIRSSDKALVSAYRYSDISSELGVLVYSEENMVQFNVIDRSDDTNKCLCFETRECDEIAMLIMSYAPSLNVNIRGLASGTLDPSFDQNLGKKRSKLKMTLEDRMRTHQEVQNARKVIIKSGKLRRPIVDENPSGLLRHTLKRLSTSRTRIEKSRFESIYGTVSKFGSAKSAADLPQTTSDYQIYSSGTSDTIQEESTMSTEVAGATAASSSDESTKTFPHRYWAYTRQPLKNSLLIIYDHDLEEAAIANFNAILTYSGLIIHQSNELNNSASTIDSGSIDSGIASQQSLSNVTGKIPGGSPSSTSSGDIYDVCPKKIDESELIRLAQSILDRCLKKDADILKNEFFLQLIKQTTDHPDPNSEINQRHWQLLALACSVTYPSDSRILTYLYAHLKRCSLDQVTDEGQYAQFTLRSLQGTLDTKGRKCAPSETEILSTINCRRVYARVYFLDGQFQAVEFDPCATIAEVVDQIKQKIGLRTECGGYALFQPLDDDCEQVLQPEEKVGDAIASWEIWQKQKQTKVDQQSTVQPIVGQNSVLKLPNKSHLATLNSTARKRTHRFIFKKYLFLDSLADNNDPIERELLYYQTISNIKEDKFPVLEQEATILCALKAQIEIGDYTKLTNLPREHIRMVYKRVIMSLMPPHAFNRLPIPMIAQQHQAFVELNCTDAKKYFFNLIQSFSRASFSSGPGYVSLHRAHIYEATQTFATAWPSDIWIVINQTGLHMLVSKSRVSLIILTS